MLRCCEIKCEGALANANVCSLQKLINSDLGRIQMSSQQTQIYAPPFPSCRLQGEMKSLSLLIEYIAHI